jgi:hypothetical protein
VVRELELVDRLYEAFVETLDRPVADDARGLAHTLGLAPSPDIPWSQVFGHAVTLAAPELVAEGMSIAAEKVRSAVLAHMLAVIEAFGTDRIEDGQIADTASTRAVLAALRRQRDRALAAVCGSELAGLIGFDQEDRAMRNAIEAERILLRSGRAVDMRTYELVSLGKQAVGFPASMALAWAAGWDSPRRAVLRRLLANVWLGLQMHDDVVDWEDDMSRGGAWAASLMRGQLQQLRSYDRPTEGPNLRKQVFETGVLRLMLARSRWHFHAARARAAALGARSLQAWAAQRDAKLTSLVEAESRSAGYAVRAHALAAWAGEVLA